MPPMLVPHRPLLMEYSIFLKSASKPWLRRYSISYSRVRVMSRVGVIISISGARIWKVRSKRTWSLPAPVEPWATASAPISLAYLIIAIAWNMRSDDTLIGYVPLRSTFPAIMYFIERS